VPTSANSRMVMDFLNERGIRLIGMAEATQIPSVPADFSPHSLLRNARTVICYAVPIPKGVVYAERNALELFWRYSNMVYRTLDGTTNQLCVTLEESGHKASPVYGCFPWKLAGRQFWGMIPLVHWAEQARLGKLTKCGLLANPQYGTRILLGAVITSAHLEASAQLPGDPCAPGCQECIDACPVNAISQTGKVDHHLCIRYSGVNPLLTHLLADPHSKQKFSFETILNTVGVDDHGAYTCNNCMKVCPLNQ
jgi:epoxyqueuosine reductase QueG